MIGGVVTASLLPERPRRGHPEADLQRAVVRYLRFALPLDATFTAIDPGGKRTQKARDIRAGMGMTAGWPDLLVIFRGMPIGIELKTPVGALSAVQKQVHQRLGYARCTVLVCRSLPGVETALRELGVPLRAAVAA